MEKECPDELEQLTSQLKGKMNFVMSHWTDKNSITSLEPSSICAGKARTCSDRSWDAFYYLRVLTKGSTQFRVKPVAKPEPEDEKDGTDGNDGSDGGDSGADEGL